MAVWSSLWRQMAHAGPNVTHLTETVGQFIRSGEYPGPPVAADLLADLDQLSFGVLIRMSGEDKQLAIPDIILLRRVVIKGAV